MSMLHFGRFFRTTSHGADQVGEETNGGDAIAGRFESQPPQASFLDDEDSSFGLPSDASLSDHEVVVGFPPGTLMEIYHERRRQQEDDGSFGGTILSSAPSNEIFPPARGEQQTHQSAMSQHPMFHVENIPPHFDTRLPFHVENALSISTTQSEYINWQSLQNSVTSADDNTSTSTSACDLSISTLEVSSVLSSFVHPIEGQSSERTLVVHGGAYRNIADRLAFQENGDWFSRFTEEDWKEFRIAANMVLQALEPMQQSSPPLALPPPTPTFATERSSNPSVQYNLLDHLPETFLCCLCHNAIVGATTLSCACDRSTVCAECWESYSTCAVEADDTGYVFITTKNTCPSCRGIVHSAVPCHALDVALLFAIQNIPEPLQLVYYSRLDQWRREVLRRRQVEVTVHQSPRHELILAELIQQEEEYFWKKNARKKQAFVRSQQALLFIGEMAICMAVASISAVGLSVLARRS